MRQDQSFLQENSLYYFRQVECFIDTKKEVLMNAIFFLPFVIKEIRSNAFN